MQGVSPMSLSIFLKNIYIDQILLIIYHCDIASTFRGKALTPLSIFFKEGAGREEE